MAPATLLKWTRDNQKNMVDAMLFFFHECNVERAQWDYTASWLRVLLPARLFVNSDLAESGHKRIQHGNLSLKGLQGAVLL